MSENNSNYFWRTPLSFFEEFNKQYFFNLDPCTTEDNPLGTEYFYTEKDDGLSKNWGIVNGCNVFCNPPYGYEITPDGRRGRYLLELWVKKGYNEALNNPNVDNVIMLLPSLTSPKWFHQYIWDDENMNFYPHVKEVSFPKQRIQFLDRYGKKKQSPRFDSMVVVFYNRNK